MKLFDELKKYCDKHGIILQIDVFRKDRNRYELTFDYFEPEELRDIRDIISDYAKIEDDVHLAGNGRAIDIYFETLDESKKSVKKSIKESTNIFDTLKNAWNKSTMNNNVFEKTVLKLKTDSFKDPFDKYSTIYMFADGSSIDCDSLDPFDCEWCTYVSDDMSFVHEFKN